MNWEKIIMIVFVLLVIGGVFLWAWAEIRDIPAVEKFCEDKGGKIIRDKCGIPNQDGAYTLYDIVCDYGSDEYMLVK